ncbi:MAG TPA: PAS domain-containing protein [Mycobacteriales bacterium]|nr:PAS domain-containing protein [Mycobacteriales bacterium]
MVTFTSPRGGGPLTVVLADDSPAARALLQATLGTREGIEVVGVAPDGRVAVELVERHHPHLAILDIAMPDMDGLEAATRIRDLGLDTRVIVLSAYNAERMATSARAAGADEYVEKAASNEELFAAIQRLFPSVALAGAAGPLASLGPEGWPHDGDESPGEQRYRLLLDALDEGVLVVDGEGVVTSANFSATRVLGRATSGIVGRHAAEFGLDEAADPGEGCSRPISATLATGRPWSNVRVVITGGDQRRRELLLSVRPLAVPGQPTPTEVLVSFADVTELRRSEKRYRQTVETLRHDKELLERLFSTMQVLIAYLDRDFTFIRVNAAYAETEGRDPDFFVGKNHFDLYPDEENKEIFRRVVATGEPHTAYEKPFEYAGHPERGVTYWDWNLRPVRDARGDVEGLVMTLVDRTERVLIRKELETVRLGVAAMVDPMVITRCRRDAEGTIIEFEVRFVNAAGLALVGKAEAEVIGRGLLEVFPVTLGRAAFDACCRVAETGDPLRTKVPWADDTGVRFFDVTISALGDGIVLIGRDVTEPVRAQRALGESEERFRAAIEILPDPLGILTAVRAEDDAAGGPAEGIVDFEYAYLNDAASRSLGQAAADVVGRRLGELVPEMRTSGVLDLYRRVVESGEPLVAPAVPFEGTFAGRRLAGVFDLRATRLGDGLVVLWRDVTDRAEAASALRASDERFRGALEAMLDAVFLCEAVRDDAGHVVDLRYTFANPAAVDVRGRRVDELVGHRLLELYPAMSRSPLFAGYLHTVDTGEPLRVEGFRYDDVVNGHGVSGVYDIQAVRHGDGVLVTYRRAGEREELIAQLAASEERFRLALDNLLDSFAILSPIRDDTHRIVDFRIDFANRKVLDVAGRGRDELVGAALSSLYRTAFTAITDGLARVVETGEPLVLDGFRFDEVDAAGRRVGAVFDIRAARVGDGCILVWRDVSDSWAAQEALRESEERFRLAAERAPIGMALVGIDGRFLLVNPALCELLGYSAAALTQTTFRNLTHPDDVAADLALLHRTLAGELDGHERDKRYLHRDGHVVWTHVVVALVRDHAGRPRHFYVQIVDVSERRRAEQQLADAHAALGRRAGELERANAELARANAELAEFAYVASHDLREPLRTIAGFADLLAERSGERLDAEGTEFLDFIRQGVDRMQELISALLAYSRVGTQPVSLGPVDTNELVDEVLQALRGKIDATGADVLVADLPVVTADRVQLGQVFQNLVANALTFVAPGVAPRISISAEPDTGGWRFVVADNGIGIKPEYRDKVFRMFQRLQAPDRYPGSGMGLAICKRIVERHGGSIDVEDNPGGGARFWFTLPERTA